MHAILNSKLFCKMCTLLYKNSIIHNILMNLITLCKTYTFLQWYNCLKPLNVDPYLKLNDFNSRSPLQRRPNVSNLQTYQITFEYGPPQLNLFRYVTQKASTLWRKAKEKCILKDNGKPMEGFLLMSGEDESIVRDSLKRFGFDKNKLEKMCEC